MSLQTSFAYRVLALILTLQMLCPSELAVADSGPAEQSDTSKATILGVSARNNTAEPCGTIDIPSRQGAEVGVGHLQASSLNIIPLDTVIHSGMALDALRATTITHSGIAFGSEGWRAGHEAFFQKYIEVANLSLEDSGAGLKFKTFMSREPVITNGIPRTRFIVAFKATRMSMRRPVAVIRDWLANFSDATSQTHSEPFKGLLGNMTELGMNSQNEIIFSGQSLGAILAQVAAYTTQAELVRRYGNRIEDFTPRITSVVWGSPGTKEIVQHYIRHYYRREYRLTATEVPYNFDLDASAVGNFFHFHFRIDPLRDFGRHIGQVYLIPQRYVRMQDGETPVVPRYIPFSKHIEAHAGKSFINAFIDADRLLPATEAEGAANPNDYLKPDKQRMSWNFRRAVWGLAGIITFPFRLLFMSSGAKRRPCPTAEQH